MKEESRNMFRYAESIDQLSRRTGFPPDALVEFAGRGILPVKHSGGHDAPTLDAFAFLRYLEVLNNAA
jgi:hypothetical protein